METNVGSSAVIVREDMIRSGVANLMKSKQIRAHANSSRGKEEAAQCQLHTYLFDRFCLDQGKLSRFVGDIEGEFNVGVTGDRHKKYIYITILKQKIKSRALFNI